MVIHSTRPLVSHPGKEEPQRTIRYFNAPEVNAAELQSMNTPGDGFPSYSDLGKKLRDARLRRRMTLQQLAKEADCSVSLISKIEHNKTAPSLRMLHRLAAGLQTSIGELFAEPSQDSIIVFREGQRPTIRLSKPEIRGTIALERLAPQVEEGRLLDGNIHVVPPGATNGGPINHSGEELGYVLAGHIELTVAEQRLILGAGDSFFFSSELPHSYKNIGTEEARILWVNSPPTF